MANHTQSKQDKTIKYLKEISEWIESKDEPTFCERCVLLGAKELLDDDE